jgi:hypothetical protein
LAVPAGCQLGGLTKKQDGKTPALPTGEDSMSWFMITSAQRSIKRADGQPKTI